MTITTTDTVERYVGDGTQRAWPITFPFFKGEDVKACIVNRAGKQVNLTYGTDYTVDKSTSSMGGTLNYVLENDVELTIWLSLPITQGTDFYNTGPLNTKVLEASFDRLTLIAQQLQEANDRSVKVATSSTETPEQLLASLYAGRDTAVSSASAATTSASNAATSEINAANSESAAAGSASTAEAWAESETPPNPNDAESKSAKTWALIAGDSVPIATATLAGKIKASDSLQVDSNTGVATVPAATETVAGIARQATPEEAAGGESDDTFMTPFDVKTTIDACRASDDDITEGTGSDKIPSISQLEEISANVNLSNLSNTAKITAADWGMPDLTAGVSKSWNTEHHAETSGYVRVLGNGSVELSSYIISVGMEQGELVKMSNIYAANNNSNACQIIPIPKGAYYKGSSGVSGQELTFYPSIGATNA